MKEGTVRLTIDVSAGLDDELLRLARQHGTTKEAAWRFALKLLCSAHQATTEGLQVGAWSEDGRGNRHERVFVGL